MSTILLIDDNRDILENTREILEMEGYNVLTAENGQAGVTKALMEIPDLIVCDIKMPIMDGFEVFLTINKNLSTSGIPFIFLSAQAEVANKNHGIKLGADDYITKPYEETLLLSTIKNRIQKHEKAKEELKQELFKYLKELEDMLHLTNHKVRAPLSTCLGLIQLLDMSINKNDREEEIAKILAHIKTSVLTLDEFTRELTDFLTNAKEKKKTKLGLKWGN